MATMRVEIQSFRHAFPILLALGVVLYFSEKWFFFLSLCLIVWLHFKAFHYFRKLLRVCFLDLGTKLTGITRKLNITEDEVNAIGDAYINTLPPDEGKELMKEIHEVYPQ